MERRVRALALAAVICCLGFGPIKPLSAAASGKSNDKHGSSDKGRGQDKQDQDKKDRQDQDCEDHDGGKSQHGKDYDRDRDKDRDDCECEAHAVLVAEAPGVSQQTPNTLFSAFVLMNTGDQLARDVRISSLRLQNGSLTSPLPLPIKLGNIPAEGSTSVNVDFSGGPFQPRSSYLLTVRGSYLPGKEKDEDKDSDKDRNRGKDGDGDKKRKCFKTSISVMIPPASPGSGQVTVGQAPPHKVSGGNFPHQPLGFTEEENGSRWTVPTGPFVPGTPTQTHTGIQNAPIGDPPAIDFEINNSLDLSSGGFNGTVLSIAEPSGGANGGGIVFITSNLIAAYSTDGGNSFTGLDPTKIFPNDVVGFCCDQIVQYVPSIDRFIWLLQGNGVRIASASPADIKNSGGTAWTYWNLTPEFFGQPTTTGLDYPDLSVGTNALYMSWDVGFPNCPPGCRSGRQVARSFLNQIQAGGTIEVDFTDPPDSPMGWGDHLSQDTADEIFWAGHNDNSHMRVFSLAEGSNTYFWRDVEISSWAQSGLTSNTPDNVDWMNKLSGFPGNGVIGATRVGNQIWFAWSAGTDNNFPQPHVEIVTLDRSNNFNKVQQLQIWNPDFAFGYPALATNICTSEVGFSMEFGGGGNFENHVVGFWGDFIAYITTNSNVGTTRFGDYVTIRQQPPSQTNGGSLFSAFGYGLNSATPPAAGSKSDLHYVLFGRPASSCVVIQ